MEFLYCLAWVEGAGMSRADELGRVQHALLAMSGTDLPAALVGLLVNIFY